MMTVIQGEIVEDGGECHQVNSVQDTGTLRTKGTSTCAIPPIANCDKSIDRLNADFNYNPNNNNDDGDDDDVKRLRESFSIVNSDDDDCSGSCSSSEREEEDKGEAGLPIASSSKFSTPTKKLPFFRRFLTRRKKRKKKKKLWQRITEIPWGENIEALLVGFAAFAANVILIGFIVCLAIYYVEFKQAFSASHGLITLSVFLPTGVFGSVGLLSGIFLNKFGVRITALTGSLLLGIGVGACSYANSVIFLFIFLGAFAGTGCSLVYLSVTMGLCSYFKTKGRLLMPLVTMGEAVGTIIFPPLTSYFIEIYNWRGSLLMMSGVMLQVTVCAMMYSVKNRHHHTKGKRSHDKDKNGKSLCLTHSKSDNQNLSDDLSNSNPPTQNTLEPLDLNSTFPEQTPGKPSLEELDPSALIDGNAERSSTEQKEENIEDPVDGSLRDSGVQGVIFEVENCLLDPVPNSESETNAHLESGSKTEEPKVRQRDTFMLIVTDKQYVLFLISVFIAIGCINTALTVLPDFCVQQGLTLSESANVYAIGASGDFIARIIGGWLVFRNQISSLVIFTISGIVMGLLISIYPFLSTFYLISLLSFFVMIHSGLLSSVYSVVVLDFFDIRKYAIAIGLSETVSGFGIVLVGYIIGLITEYNNGSYVVSFYIISLMSVISMLPMLILYLYKRKTFNKIPQKCCSCVTAQE